MYIHKHQWTVIKRNSSQTAIYHLDCQILPGADYACLSSADVLKGNPTFGISEKLIIPVANGKMCSSLNSSSLDCILVLIFFSIL